MVDCFNQEATLMEYLVCTNVTLSQYCCICFVITSNAYSG